MGRQKIYRVTVRLDMEHDADLINWLKGLVPGSRSGLIRAVWRAGLRQLDGQVSSRWEPVDIEEMRRMIAEELVKALAGRPVVSETTASADVDIEAKYGAKLDRMLGGLAGSNSNAYETDDHEQ